MSADLVSLHTKRLREALAPVIARGQKVALAGFIEGPNAGNHAMWLGEKRLLAELGANLVYECSAQSYDRSQMAEKLGDGLILLHGGSTASRLAAQRGFRWKVLEDFPAHAAVAFPHQPTPADEPFLARAAQSLAKGRELTLFAASEPARATLVKHFGSAAKIALAPDSTFLLGHKKRQAEIAYEIVWIARTDGDRANEQTETTARLASQAAEKLAIPGASDGVEISYVAKLRPQTILLTDWQAFVFENEFARMAMRRLDFDAWAQVYVARAFHVLSLGQVLITDRLHAHLLAMLLEIPTVLLNDDAGRNFAYRESWTKQDPRVEIARNPSEAWGMARQAAARLKELGPSEAGAWTWSDIEGSSA